MGIRRRRLLEGAVAGTAVVAAAGLVVPRAVLGAWPQTAFKAREAGEALTGLLGTDAASASEAITIKAPEIAENGAVVPVTVETTLEGVESIAIVATKNPTPLTSNFVLGEGAEGYVSTRIKMAQTSPVLAVVKAGGGLYSTQREVKVTIGGCGG